MFATLGAHLHNDVVQYQRDHSLCSSKLSTSLPPPIAVTGTWVSQLNVAKDGRPKTTSPLPTKACRLMVDKLGT